MGLFSSNHPKNISSDLLAQKVLPDLYANGFSSKEIESIKSLAEMQMVNTEPNELRAGLSQDEIGMLAEEMSRNPALAHITPDKIAKFKDIATKHLNSQH